MKDNTLRNLEKAFRRHTVKGAKLFAAALMIPFLYSCEQTPSLESINVKESVVQDAKGGKNPVQFFVADLHPLNNSGVTGTATFQYKEGAMFKARVKADGLVPGKPHPQHIHGFEPGADGKSGDAECPPPSAAGADGLIDLAEGLPFYGPIIVPLDDQLVPLTAGDFPVANPAGIISYVETVGYHELISAIETTFSMKNQEGLNLEKRSVVLHGAFVKDGEIVPPGTEGAEYVATLPVACGEIRAVRNPSGY